MAPQTDSRNIIRYAPTDLAVRPSQVARYFGGARYDPDAQTRERIAEAISEGLGLIRPAAALSLHRIKETTPAGDIVLAGGLTLPGGAGLCGPRNVYLTAVVGTLGPQLEERCRELARRGDVYAATLMDAVGVALLDELGEKLHHDLAHRASDNGLFCGCRLGPGLNDLPVEAQALIFKMTDTGAIGVALNDSFMMQPVKSISFLAAMGPAPVRLPDIDKCRQCNLAGCRFRKVR